MSKRMNRTTNLSTCYRRGALIHEADMFMDQARKEVSKGNMGDFANTVWWGVGGRMVSLMGIVPKNMEREARMAHVEAAQIVGLVEKKASKKAMLIGIGKLQKRVDSLKHKIKSACKAE